MKFDKEIEQLINKWRKVLEEQLQLPEHERKYDTRRIEVTIIQLQEFLEQWNNMIDDRYSRYLIKLEDYELTPYYVSRYDFISNKSIYSTLKNTALKLKELEAVRCAVGLCHPDYVVSLEKVN